MADCSFAFTGEILDTSERGKWREMEPGAEEMIWNDISKIPHYGNITEMKECNEMRWNDDQITFKHDMWYIQNPHPLKATQGCTNTEMPKFIFLRRYLL